MTSLNKFMSNTQEGICKYANSGTVDLLLAPARKHIAVVVLTWGGSRSKFVTDILFVYEWNKSKGEFLKNM